MQNSDDKPSQLHGSFLYQSQEFRNVSSRLFQREVMQFSEPASDSEQHPPDGKAD